MLEALLKALMIVLVIVAIVIGIVYGLRELEVITQADIDAFIQGAKEIINQ